ncbi:hypothetical protein [Miltoncostaea oceani]|uniref:hypothetical protein n=1 Tax=Miltoncostaea oceani TaxID=2843216 RepID=UPI001C3D0C64|nr:hypothetical protein [Miltoncostaea oceani]
MSTLVAPPQNAATTDTVPEVSFSPRAALAQLRFVWPGLVARNEAMLREALEQVDETFIAGMLAEHPRADSCAIARVGKHEVVLRGLSRRAPTAYWVEGRLLGTYHAHGRFAEAITQMRSR